MFHILSPLFSPLFYYSFVFTHFTHCRHSLSIGILSTHLSTFLFEHFQLSRLKILQSLWPKHFSATVHSIPHSHSISNPTIFSRFRAYIWKISRFENQRYRVDELLFRKRQSCRIAHIITEAVRFTQAGVTGTVTKLVAANEITKLSKFRQLERFSSIRKTDLHRRVVSIFIISFIVFERGLRDSRFSTRS